MIAWYASPSKIRSKFALFHTCTICVVNGSIDQKAVMSSVASEAR